MNNNMINLSYEGSPKGLMEYIGREICDRCFGQGLLRIYEGDNIETKVCNCRMQEWNDRTEEQ